MWQPKPFCQGECPPFIQVHLLSCLSSCLNYWHQIQFLFPCPVQRLYFSFNSPAKSLSGHFSLSSIIFSCLSLSVQISPISFFLALLFFTKLLLSLFWAFRELIALFPFCYTLVFLSALLELLRPPFGFSHLCFHSLYLPTWKFSAFSPFLLNSVLPPLTADFKYVGKQALI